MILSLIHSTEPELEMITLPLSQVRAMAQSINRASLRYAGTRQAIIKLLAIAAVRKYDVSIDLPEWSEFVEAIENAHDLAAPEAGQP